MDLQSLSTDESLEILELTQIAPPVEGRRSFAGRGLRLFANRPGSAATASPKVVNVSTPLLRANQYCEYARDTGSRSNNTNRASGSRSAMARRALSL